MAKIPRQIRDAEKHKIHKITIKGKEHNLAIPPNYTKKQIDQLVLFLENSER